MIAQLGFTILFAALAALCLLGAGGFINLLIQVWS